MTHTFAIGTRVVVDGDSSLVLTVIGVWYRTGGCLYHLSCYYNADLKENWVEEWRIQEKQA